MNDNVSKNESPSENQKQGGSTLDIELMRGEINDPKQRIKAARQICWEVQKHHSVTATKAEKKIVYCDIQPSNIKRNALGQLKFMNNPIERDNWTETPYLPYSLFKPYIEENIKKLGPEQTDIFALKKPYLWNLSICLGVNNRARKATVFFLVMILKNSLLS